MDNKVILEDQIRQVLSSVVWSHKIQEKQSDIYMTRYEFLENTRIILSVIISSGILATILIEGNLIKIVTGVISVATLIINSYFKTYDLSKLRESHKRAARELLKLREKYISLLCDMKMDKLTEEQIMIKRDELLAELMSVYEITESTGNRAVEKAKKGLEERKEHSYSDESVDYFLPLQLRRYTQENASKEEA